MVDIRKIFWIIIGIIALLLIIILGINNVFKESHNPETNVIQSFNDYDESTLNNETNNVEQINEQAETNNTEMLSKNSNETPEQREEKAKKIVEKEWGTGDGVTFNFVEINKSNGKYIVSVNLIETTEVVAWYEVNVDAGTCERDWDL